FPWHYFFFQAEDGIRDFHVTGVQTCALPIYKVVASFTGGIVSPLIGLIFKSDFNDLKYVITPGTLDEAGNLTGEIAVLYGEFLTNVIDFIIVAFVMFLIIKGINRMKKKEEPAPEAPKGPTQEELLAEIRDLLKK